jgi:hypothetical protein
MYVFVCVLMYTYLHVCMHSYIKNNNKEKGVVKESKGKGKKYEDIFVHIYVSKLCTCT